MTIVNVGPGETEDGTAEAGGVASLSRWVFWTICELMRFDSFRLRTDEFLLESVTGHLKSRDRSVYRFASCVLESSNMMTVERYHQSASNCGNLVQSRVLFFLHCVPSLVRPFFLLRGSRPPGPP